MWKLVEEMPRTCRSDVKLLLACSEMQNAGSQKEESWQPKLIDARLFRVTMKWLATYIESYRPNPTERTPKQTS